MQSLWMLVAAALFAVLGAFEKLPADRYHIAEIVLYRGLTGTLALAGRRFHQPEQGSSEAVRQAE